MPGCNSEMPLPTKSKGDSLTDLESWRDSAACQLVFVQLMSALPWDVSLRVRAVTRLFGSCALLQHFYNTVGTAEKPSKQREQAKQAERRRHEGIGRQNTPRKE